MEEKYCLIIVVVKRGFADVVMEAAKNEGAKGGTILHARGTSHLETNTFMGLNIQPEKDLVLILVENDKKKAIMKAINEKAGLSQEGGGLAFSLPVDDAIGTFTKR